MKILLLVIIFATLVVFENAYRYRSKTFIRAWKVLHYSNSLLSPLHLTVLHYTYLKTTALKATANTQEIYESDERFISLLQRNMENQYNASPREVTNRLKIFFSRSGTRPPDEIAAFKKYLDANIYVLDGTFLFHLYKP